MAETSTVRQALGLGGAPTRVEGLTVVVDPLADGLPTIGMATVLQLSSTAQLTRATGTLSTGRAGDLYPLRTARQAFDRIPIAAIGAPCDVSGCPQGPVVTGARLGLSRVTLEQGAASLVPSWLFTVKGSPVPVAILAIADPYLGSPGAAATPPRTDPATTPGTDPATTPSTDPGAGPGNAKRAIPTPETTKTETKPPVQARSTPALPADPENREAFPFDGAYADSNPQVLVIRYPKNCFPRAARPDVVQDKNRVAVTLTRTVITADSPEVASLPHPFACTADYQPVLVRITLSAPLGNRKVIDGSRQVPVPISTGTPPFG